jgi:hypothetical protein
MVYPCFIFIMDDRNDIEACFQVNIFPEDIGISRPDQRLLLLSGNCLFRFGKCVAAPRFYLDDDKKILILRNDIDFIAPRPPVRIKDMVSLLQEVRNGDLFLPSSLLSDMINKIPNSIRQLADQTNPKNPIVQLQTVQLSNCKLSIVQLQTVQLFNCKLSNCPTSSVFLFIRKMREIYPVVRKKVLLHPQPQA